MREVTALRSECEQLRVQVELLTGEKDAAFEELERLKDQVLSRARARARFDAPFVNSVNARLSLDISPSQYAFSLLQVRNAAVSLA